MSASASTSPTGPGVSQASMSRAPTPVDAVCPLCGAPLHQEQEWCLHCGAAARTRLAAPASWKAPLVAIAVVATLALGVLAASLVALSGGSGTAKAPPPVTTTITAATPTTPGAIPTTSSGTGATGATGPGGITGPGGAVAPTGGGAVAPGTPTTLTPSSTATAGAQTSGSNSAATTTTVTNPASAEEALRKAGFLPRTKK
jgi:hypothetical protein